MITQKAEGHFPFEPELMRQHSIHVRGMRLNGKPATGVELFVGGARMSTLLQVLPDPDALLALPPEELGPVVLKVAWEARPNHAILLQDVTTQIRGRAPDYRGYPQAKHAEVELALSEAWNWLLVQGIIILGDSSPWFIVSRRGKALLKTGDFKTFAQAAGFPKSLLHPTIADAVWLDLARGDFETAIFRACKAVEIAVREAANFTNDDYGVQLIRKAFDKKTGPLTDTAQTEGERGALSHLFAGTMGLYRNASGHRLLVVDHREAQEIVVLASHLLRIVDARKSARP